MQLFNVDTDKVKAIFIINDGKYVDCYERLETDTTSGNLINKTYVKYDDGGCLCIDCGNTVIPPKNEDAIWTFFVDESGFVRFFAAFSSEEEMFNDETMKKTNPIRLTNKTPEQIKEARSTMLAAEPASVFYMPAINNERCPECAIGVKDLTEQIRSMGDIIEIICESLDDGGQVVLYMDDESYYVMKVEDELNLTSTHYIKE